MSIRIFVSVLLLAWAMTGSGLAQSPIARFVYEEAEDSYAKQDYSTALIKLEKAEKEFGKINPPILYLRIMARNEILKASTGLDFDNLKRLREDRARYLKDYGEMESVRDQAREVYKVSTTLDKYPATREAYLKEEEARIEAASRQAAARLKENMALVKGGCFQMGNTFGGLFSSEGENDERPVHEVCLNDFYMGKYEVTVGEFREFVNASGYKTEAETSGGCYVWIYKWELDSGKNWKSPGFSQTDKDPVVCINWNDANRYLDYWNRRLTGISLRLPTEAEWEYAARSGGRRRDTPEVITLILWHGITTIQAARPSL